MKKILKIKRLAVRITKPKSHVDPTDNTAILFEPTLRPTSH